MEIVEKVSSAVRMDYLREKGKNRKVLWLKFYFIPARICKINIIYQNSRKMKNCTFVFV